jgi:hypothetical protein
MRRALVVLTVVVAVALGVVAPAGAASGGKALNREVTGSFSGTSRWTFGDGCNFVHQVFDGTLTADAGKGASSYHFDTCVDAFGLFPISGTFTITTARGDTVSGTLNGDLDGAATLVVPIDWTLTATSGTGRFRRATGTIEVVGTLDFIEMLSFRTVDEGRFEASLTRH